MDFKVEFENFYKNNIGNIFLSPPVFYKFPIGLRFEIGDDNSENQSIYIKQARLRAKTIFDELFNKNDDLYLIVDSCEKYKDFYFCGGISCDTIGIVRSLLSKINNEYCYEKLTHKYDGDDEECPYSRYIIETSKDSINVDDLLVKIIESEIKGQSFLANSIYFINKKNGIVYFLYDDRGLDIVANIAQKLKNVYHKFNDWILEHDREKIEEVFKHI